MRIAGRQIGLLRFPVPPGELPQRYIASLADFIAGFPDLFPDQIRVNRIRLLKKSLSGSKVNGYVADPIDFFQGFFYSLCAMLARHSFDFD
jgi:hypothetical protein